MNAISATSQEILSEQLLRVVYEASQTHNMSYRAVDVWIVEADILGFLI